MVTANTNSQENINENLTHCEDIYPWRVENLVTLEVAYCSTRSQALEVCEIMKSKTPNTCIVYLGHGDYIIAERKKK